MMTKWRLLIDFILQLVILLIAGLLLAFYPQYSWMFWLGTVVLLAGWQLLHAWYVVHKHKDWQRGQYLFYFKRIAGYGLLASGVGLLMALISFGMLTPFASFMNSVVGWGLLVSFSLLVLFAFFVSLRRLYQYYHQPRSFWDLK